MEFLPRSENERKDHKVESLSRFLQRYQAALILRRRREIPGRQCRHLHDSSSGDDRDPADSGDAARSGGAATAAPCEIQSKGEHGGSALVSITWDKQPAPRFGSSALYLPQSIEALRPAAEAFCQAFPDQYFYVDDSRGLAAGFHLVEGFFRDDRPLVSMVLSDGEKAELDRLWQELDFVTESAETLLRGVCLV